VHAHVHSDVALLEVASQSFNPPTHITSCLSYLTVLLFIGTIDQEDHSHILTAGLSMPGVKVGVSGGMTGGGATSFLEGGAATARDGGWPSTSGDFSA